MDALLAHVAELAQELIAPRHGDTAASAAKVCALSALRAVRTARKRMRVCIIDHDRWRWVARQWRTQLYKALLPTLLMIRWNGTALAGATIPRAYLDGAERATQIVLYVVVGAPLRVGRG